MQQVLITGANGFVGQYLISTLLERNYQVTAAYRSSQSLLELPGIKQVVTGSINEQTQWQEALDDVDVVVHLAARVHVMQETQADPLKAFREINTEGTINLAKQAIKAGVKRFVYISTIKVNGEQTLQEKFHADDQVNPQDPYAHSKYEAEQQLLALSKEQGFEVVIIRPPLVYGPGVKGNFKRLINLVNKGLPLPLARINNSRSLVSIQNLCSLIEVCLYHPKAAGEVFLVSDGEDISTSELFEKLAYAMHKPNRLFFFPQWLIRIAAVILGRKAEYDRLFGSLQVDIAKNRQLLEWSPPLSVDQGIEESVKA